MVEVRRVRVRGVWVWAEISPDRCGAGHPKPTPFWGACPGCGQMCRCWICRTCDEVISDHQHEAAPGADR